MKISIVLSLLYMSTTLMYGRFDATATQSCQAYNNLKHSANTHRVRLRTNTHYRVIRHHKGQYLIQIPDATPATRWVDEACLDHVATNEHAGHGSHRQELLVISWQNSFCQYHRHIQECRNGSGDNRLTLHGLWPQPRSRNYCDVPPKLIARDKHHQWRSLPKPRLSQDLISALRRVMPGYESGLHRHEWIKHGTCYRADAQRYFGDAVRWTERIAHGAVGQLIRTHVGEYVTLAQLRRALERDMGRRVGDKLELRCDRGLLSELRLHLGGDSLDLADKLSHGTHAHSRCHRALIDAPGY